MKSDKQNGEELLDIFTRILSKLNIVTRMEEVFLWEHLLDYYKARLEIKNE